MIKVKDLAYGRLRSPDLDAAEEFLTHFGMIRAARTPTALYMRGTDPQHHLHVTEKGDPRFLGLAYYAASDDDLRRVAKAPGASPVESIDEPGGGRRVRLREPNGYQIEVVHGIEPLPPIPVPTQHMNTGTEPLRRAGALMRLRQSPSPIKRMGHGVLGTPKVKETVQWFRETLGFICSDDVYAGDKDHIIGSFNRCDRGDEYVDHHTLFCVHNERADSTTCRSRCPTWTPCSRTTSTSRGSASTTICGAWAATCSAARSTTTGPIPGAASTSAGPIPIASTRRAAAISCRPRKGSGASGARTRRRGSSST